MTPGNIQQHAHAHRSLNGVRYSYGQAIPTKRSRTPNPQDTPSSTGTAPSDKDPNAVDLGRNRLMKDLYARSERMLDRLLSAPQGRSDINESSKVAVGDAADLPSAKPDKPQSQTPKAVRTLDEDDYGDEEDDEGEEEEIPASRSGDGLDVEQDEENSPNRSATQQSRHAIPHLGRESTSSSQAQARSPEEVRKRLEEEKKAAEQTARDNFLNTFYTLENDRDAMLEQQKLDDLDRQVENEMSGPDGNNATKSGTGAQPGSLSSANLGASSLALKHLISRIDAKRDMVHASDSKLRSLMSEVRKNRSKWANEERVGQEELYEAAERVLMDLKGMTEYAAPFLQRVNRRDAPDYHKIITKPMDIGSMIKKLKSLEYKSKKEFVHDLDLIWANCFKYNADPNHFLRKKAEHMKKETARLIPLIPDIVIRDRAEVEAEERDERRKQFADLDSDDDDDQPIVATRGRKAPSKKGLKGTSSARKAPPPAPSDSPAPDARPSLPPTSGVRNEFLRVDADAPADGSQHGLSTPPPGSTTPQGGGSAIDGATRGDDVSMDGMHIPNLDQAEDPDDEDEAYKTWKQVTKKDRAQVASDRHRLFRSDRLNPEEPALLRTKAGMRRWMRQQKRLIGEESTDDPTDEPERPEASDAPHTSTTLAEGIDADDDSVLPDYYHALAGVPQFDSRIQWVEDSEGYVVDRREECLKIVPKGQFTAGESALATRIDSNMKQMQDTRKVMAKIGMVKQMQVQSQTYQNQFQKYEPEPLREADIEPTVVSDDGPVMAPWVSRAALQRSVGKIFYHAGFEDYQPSTLDAVTDLAADHFKNLVKTLKAYQESPMVQSAPVEATTEDVTLQAPSHLSAKAPDFGKRQMKARFSNEEAILHTLRNNGHELDSLTTYIEEDVPRISTKLAAHHENVRQYYADLVRPALDPTSVAYDGGASAFNDGSESQFVAGDFAEDIDEDFFGFKELGLDREFGISALSVPLHLLQSRMHNAYQPAAAAGANSATTETIMSDPPAWKPVTMENVYDEIGLVQAFFLERLEKAEGAVLIEDEELPQKQRFPKPRLPPTGKISSPRKRPPREQAMMARKKKRLEIEAEKEREREESGALARGTSTVSATGSLGAATDQVKPGPTTTMNPPTGSEDQASESRRPSVALVNGDLPNGTSETVNGAAHDVNVDGKRQNDGDENNDELRPVKKLKLDTPKEASATPNTDPEKGGNKSTVDKDQEVNHEATERTSPNTEEDKADEGVLLSPEALPIAAH